MNCHFRNSRPTIHFRKQADDPDRLTHSRRNCCLHTLSHKLSDEFMDCCIIMQGCDDPALIVPITACLVQERMSLNEVEEEFCVSAQAHGDRWDKSDKGARKGMVTRASEAAIHCCSKPAVPINFVSTILDGQCVKNSSSPSGYPPM